MTPRHHVLLIGIDAYDGGGMLTGCVNDIDAVQRLLIDRVGVPSEHIRRLAAPRSGDLHETAVPERLPLLETIREELARLGTEEVGPEDRVFIYYSGHGTQAIVADDQDRRFAREALLPKDKVSGRDYRLLFDWEINDLIARITARTKAVTVILDCCNSAGATREVVAGEPDPGVRYYPTPEVQLDKGVAPPIGSARGVASGLGVVEDCQVVAACRDDQRARESADAGGVPHGELTRALLSRFSDVPDDQLHALRWGEIWRDVETAVSVANPRQSPWLSGSFGRKVFGFGPDDGGDPGYSVGPLAGEFRIGAGTHAGVTIDAEIGVYGPRPPQFPVLDSAEDLAARLGTLRVVEADAASSHAVPLAPFTLPEAPRGRLVRAGRAAKLGIGIVPPDLSLDRSLEASPFLELVEPDRADLLLERRPDLSWTLIDDVHGPRNEDPRLVVLAPDQLDRARDVVEHFYAYDAPLRMARSCGDLPNLLRMWVIECPDPIPAAEADKALDLPQLSSGVRWPYEAEVGNRICIAVENAAPVGLSVSLFDCAPSGRVLLLGEKRMPPRTVHVFFQGATLGVPFELSLPPGRMVGVDRLVAIATTRTDVSLRFLELATSFDQVLTSSKASLALAREDLGRSAEERPVDGWTSALTAVRIRRRQP